MSPAPKHFIVIVPGYMGSLLRDKKDGSIVWIDIPAMLRKPAKIEDALNTMLQKMIYPNDDLEPAGILNQMLIAEPWVKQEHYIRLIDKLKVWGYQINPENPAPDDLAVYTFAYDWRQDNRISGRQLAEALQRWQHNHPGAKAWLLAHSNGGIISRWCIQKEGGRDLVEKLLLMGSPWDGAPKSLRVLMEGMEVLGLKRFNLWNLGPRMKDLIRSFPSYYQLIPVVNPFIRDEDNQVVDLFDDPRWLENDRDRDFLKRALQFNRDLAEPTGVETICFYGINKVTTTAAVAHRTPAGKLTDIQWIETPAGDGTVPSRSAAHPWVNTLDRLYFTANHGDIYVNDTVFEYLNVELVEKYVGGTRAGIYLPDFSVVFEPEKDFYTPGEMIHTWARLSDPNTGGPIQDADVKMKLSFREALPGSEEVASPPVSGEIRLEENEQSAGRYEGSVAAPAVEGYYQLEATIKRVNKPLVHVTELVVVEAD
jgi:hypothetical protein